MMDAIEYLSKGGDCEHSQDIVVVWIVHEDPIDPRIIQFVAVEIVYLSSQP